MNIRKEGRKEVKEGRNISRGRGGKEGRKEVKEGRKGWRKGGRKD